MQCLAEELSKREKSFAERRNTENLVAVQKRLTEGVKQLLAHMTELEGKAMMVEKSIWDFKIKLEATGKRAEDVAYQWDGLQTRLQQSQRGQDKMGESIICMRDKMDSFRAGLKTDEEYMESAADEKDRKILSNLGAWISKVVVEHRKSISRPLDEN